jgi:hypothetical protein
LKQAAYYGALELATEDKVPATAGDNFLPEADDSLVFN